MFRSSTIALMTISLALTQLHAAEALSPDPNLPRYTPVSGLSGTLNSAGSDTLGNMMGLWSEAFQAMYPTVTVQIEAKGSSTAPPALITGAAQLGPMSRAMKSTELDEFEASFGYKPTKIQVALDALAVFTNKDNPLDGVTMQELDAIFSRTYKREHEPISTWRPFRLGSSFDNRQISIYGRNSASGTYGFFKEVVLLDGDFKSQIKEQPGSSGVVQGIASDLYGIGYSGIGYKTSGVNAIAVEGQDGFFYFPTFENCMSGDYPLARFLYVYVNKNPRESLDRLTHEFLKFILSYQGQEVVIRDGYFPLPAAFVIKIRNELR